MPFKDELTQALNRACAENRSHTPDFILAHYLIGCLNAFDVAVNSREQWYGRENNGPPQPSLETPIEVATPPTVGREAQFRALLERAQPLLIAAGLYTSSAVEAKTQLLAEVGKALEAPEPCSELEMSVTPEPARKDLQHPDAGPRGDRYPFGDPQ